MHVTTHHHALLSREAALNGEPLASLMRRAALDEADRLRGKREARES